MNLNEIKRNTSVSRLPIFRVLSLCSGIGGDAAALQLAGIDHKIVATAEVCPVASQVLSQKFPTVPNEGDLTKADWSEYDNIDILAAGIPCQPFSQAGKQRGAEDRRELTQDVVRIVEEVTPDYALFENVRQYETLHGGKAFRRLRRGLERAGYKVAHLVIDASNLLPQRRKRLFILAVRRGACGSPSEILSHAESRGRCLAESRKAQVQASGPATRSAAVLHPQRLGTLMASASGMNRAGMRGHELDFLVVQDFPGKGLVVRRPTPTEALRAQGFPDDWFEGVEIKGRPLRDLEKYKLVGNSWPVPITAGILSGIQEARMQVSNQTSES